MNFKKLSERYNKLGVQKKHLAEVSFFVVEYGLITNVITASLFNNPINLLNIAAYGLIWYILEYEVVKIRKAIRIKEDE